MSKQTDLFPPLPRNNRIQIGLDSTTLSVIDRFSSVAGKPRSRVIAEILQSMVPVLDEVSVKLEPLKKLSTLSSVTEMRDSAQRVALGLRDVLDTVSVDLEQMQ
jgi:hypothetical protein